MSVKILVVVIPEPPTVEPVELAQALSLREASFTSSQVFRQISNSAYETNSETLIMAIKKAWYLALTSSLAANQCTFTKSPSFDINSTPPPPCGCHLAFLVIPMAAMPLPCLGNALWPLSPHSNTSFLRRCFHFSHPSWQAELFSLLP